MDQPKHLLYLCEKYSQRLQRPECGRNREAQRHKEEKPWKRSSEADETMREMKMREKQEEAGIQTGCLRRIRLGPRGLQNYKQFELFSSTTQSVWLCLLRLFTYFPMCPYRKSSHLLKAYVREQATGVGI